jgi:hypothetical protein
VYSFSLYLLECIDSEHSGSLAGLFHRRFPWVVGLCDDLYCLSGRGPSRQSTTSHRCLGANQISEVPKASEIANPSRCRGERSSPGTRKPVGFLRAGKNSAAVREIFYYARAARLYPHPSDSFDFRPAKIGRKSVSQNYLERPLPARWRYRKAAVLSLLSALAILP